VLGAFTSGYYAWAKQPPSARALAERALSERIRAIHTQSRGIYGAPHVHAALRYEGVCCSRKRVAAATPDLLWVADITHLPTWTGFLSLAVVFDACSRRVVG